MSREGLKSGELKIPKQVPFAGRQQKSVITRLVATDAVLSAIHHNRVHTRHEAALQGR